VTGARPLRALLVSANFRPSVGGVERYVETLAVGLADRGHDVTVLTATAGGTDRLDGVRIVRVPATDVLRTRLNVPYPLPEPVSLVGALRRLLRDADVVNPHDAIYATSVAALTIARAMRVPSVLTQHVGFVPQGRRGLDLVQHGAVATLGRAAGLASRVVTYNPAVAEWVERTWGVGDVHVLPPGVPDPPTVDRDAVRARYGLPRDRFLALFAGRDVPKKGLDVFLAAADPAYELVAVTDRVAVNGAHHVPFVEPDEFRHLLASVDAFVLPSEGEGFPLTLQEALVTGLPCVVVRGPGYDHYIRPGEVLYVERSASAIRKALRSVAGQGTLSADLGSRAREAGRREFGVPSFLDAYESVYACD
jgi:D-inositol-3-phosphate glycosyltransferase